MNALTAIRYGTHNATFCYQNCKSNGKIYNHQPFKCSFQTQQIRNLIQHKKIEVDTLPDQEWPKEDEKAMKVADFDFKSDLTKERKRELELGLRTDDDIKELVTPLEQM